MSKRTSAMRTERRAPMGSSAHEIARAARGRTSSSKTPVHIRNTTSATLDREWIHQRLGFKLGKFAGRIDRADITLADESGPTGEPTFRATIQLAVPRREPIVVSSRADSPEAAIAAALRSSERTIRRAVERRQAARIATDRGRR